MTDYAKLGWLDRIVDVNWGEPYYTLLDLFVDATSDTSQSIRIVPAKGVKIVFKRDQMIDLGAPATTFPIAYVDAQSMPFPTDVHSQHVGCRGDYIYFTGTGFTGIGHASANVAWAHAGEDNGIVGGWFNNVSTPSSAKSAWCAMPEDLATDPAFSDIPVGNFADGGAASAFATAVAAHQGSGGWPNSPPVVEPDPANPAACEVVTSFTTYPPWFPSIVTGTVTGATVVNLLREYVVMMEGTSSGAMTKVCDVYLLNGDFNTFAYSFKKKDHKLDAGNTDRCPLGAPRGRVYFPLSPSSGETDYEPGLDDGGHKQVWIKDGILTIL